MAGKERDDVILARMGRTLAYAIGALAAGDTGRVFGHTDEAIAFAESVDNGYLRRERERATAAGDAGPDDDANEGSEVP